MSTAPRAPGEATSPAGTIALFYQWYNYDEIRMALASKYFTLQSTSGYTTKFLCNKDCKIKFSFLRNSPGGFWLTFNGNVISEGFNANCEFYKVRFSKMTKSRKNIGGGASVR